MNNKTNIKNHGGTRSGSDRRKNKKTECSVEKRSKNDRRSGFDRRKGPGRKRVLKDGIPIERRDVFREGV